MSFLFNAKKVAQLVGVFANAYGVRRLNIMATLKLLYLTDRQSLAAVGSPVTGDTPFAMKYGPVLSRTYDLFKSADDFPPKDTDPEADMWRHFFRRDGHFFEILQDPGDDELSPFEIELAQSVAEHHEINEPFQLSELTHQFPEWRNNELGESSSAIPIDDILTAVGKPELIPVARANAAEDRALRHLFGC
jgi:uncharacterized phage-associated protein